MTTTQPSTIGQRGRRLWVYPVEVRGRFTTLRNTAALLLGALFYAAPWIRVPTSWHPVAGSDAAVHWAPLIQLNFLSGHFILFGQTILIYEVYRFVFLAIMLALVLFLSAALYGRLWCGYACPQSIFIDRLMRLVEHLIEGSATHRKSAAHKKLTPSRLARKTLTQLVFALISASFAWTVVALFAGVQNALAMDSLTLIVPFAVLTLLAWFDGAYWREQFCIIVCPYARFQGVMTDNGTRSVGYDITRGEPRGRIQSKTSEPHQKGDCIDCGLCVRVCPTGIDIRNGSSQLECIGCAKCADACDGVMTQIGRHAGLIRYDTLARLTTRTPEGALPSRPPLLRMRTALYGLAIIALAIYGVWAFLRHDTLVVRVIPTNRDPFVRVGDRVSNLFTIKIGNQSGEKQDYSIRVESPQQGVTLESPATLKTVSNGAERSLPVLVTFDPMKLGDMKTLELRVTAIGGGQEVRVRRNLIAP